MRRAAVSLVLLTGACSRPAAMTVDDAVTPGPTGAPVVTLERTPCFGTCPVYRVSIASDGTVRFEGKRYVARQGMATASISPAAVDSLAAELKAGGYFGFADRYENGDPACGQYATDAPSAITSLSLDGQTKSIRHDYGCAATPAELRRLEERIDEVAGTEQWIGRE